MNRPDGAHQQLPQGEDPRFLQLHEFEASYANLDLPAAFGAAEDILGVDTSPLTSDEIAAGLHCYELPPREDTYDSVAAWQAAAEAGQDVQALMHQRNTIFAYAGSYRVLDGTRDTDPNAVGLEVVGTNERGGLSRYLYTLPGFTGLDTHSPVSQKLRDMVRARGFLLDGNTSKLLHWAQHSGVAGAERVAHLLTADNNELADELGIHSFGVHSAVSEPVSADLSPAPAAQDPVQARTTRPEDAITEPVQIVPSVTRPEPALPVEQERPVTSNTAREAPVQVELSPEEALAILRHWRTSLDPIDPARLAAAREVADRIADGGYEEQVAHALPVRPLRRDEILAGGVRRHHPAEPTRAHRGGTTARPLRREHILAGAVGQELPTQQRAGHVAVQLADVDSPAGAVPADEQASGAVPGKMTAIGLPKRQPGRNGFRPRS